VLNIKNSFTEGEGNLFYPNGDYYIGSFQGGKRWGNGTMKYANKNNYTGQWKNDLKEGKGSNKLIHLFNILSRNSDSNIVALGEQSMD
jgi:hypothetical protein